MRKLIVTGLPRSGTMYVSCLLGLPHEAYYVPECPGARDVDEASWLAVPFVPHLKNSHVACVLRDLDDVCVSLSKRPGLWDEPFSRFGLFIQRSMCLAFNDRRFAGLRGLPRLRRFVDVWHRASLAVADEVICLEDEDSWRELGRRFDRRPREVRYNRNVFPDTDLTRALKEECSV